MKHVAVLKHLGGWGVRVAAQALQAKQMRSQKPLVTSRTETYSVNQRRKGAQICTSVQTRDRLSG